MPTHVTSENPRTNQSTIPAIDRARQYLAKIPPALKGNRNHSLNEAAFNLVAAVGTSDLSFSDFEHLLLGYNASFQPPLPESEAKMTIRSAFNAAAQKFPDGKGNGNWIKAAISQSNGKAAPAANDGKKPIYDPKKEITPIPTPLPDGTRALLKAMFEPGEAVRIAAGTFGDDDEDVDSTTPRKDHPKDAGVTLTLEEWLRKLGEANGDPNKIFSVAGAEQPGLFLGLNPYKMGGTKDSDVTAFRHVLIENDTIPIAEQWNLIVQSNIPCTGVIFSGGRSLHAIVRVDAKNREEYDQRCKILFDHFDAYSIDRLNHNPGRLTRLPNCKRGDSRQELLALKIGSESFSQWLIDRDIEGIGELITLDALFAFDSESDPNLLLGQRWVCRGGSVLWVAQSGIGKSTMAMQAAVQWGLGRSLFGIQPVKALKSLVIQHENDIGDLSEMIKGVWLGMQLGDHKESVNQINKNLIIIRERSKTGENFLIAIRRLIDKHKPDLVWVDPLYTYMGDDISKQDVCSRFLCDGLGPITDATGVAWMFMHHTGKPSQDPGSRSKWKKHDHNYSGLGSSTLTNWIRAVVSFEAVTDNNQFVMRLGKRGKRAGAKDLNGHPTDTIYLAHATEGICWVQTEKPAELEEEQKPRRSRTTEGRTFTPGGKSGRPKAGDYEALTDLADSLAGMKVSYSRMRELFADLHGITSTTTFDRRLRELKQCGLIITDVDSGLYSAVPASERPIVTENQ